MTPFTPIFFYPEKRSAVRLFCLTQQTQYKHILLAIQHFQISLIQMNGSREIIHLIIQSKRY